MADSHTTLEDVLAVVRAYVRDAHPDDQPVRLAIWLKSGEQVRLPISNPAAVAPCTHSEDYRSVRWYGQPYSFTALQAAVVKLLWEAWQGGTPEVGQAVLLEAAGSAGSRVRDLFRGHAAWDDGAIGPGTRGTFRLYAPDEID